MVETSKVGDPPTIGGPTVTPPGETSVRHWRMGVVPRNETPKGTQIVRTPC